MKSCEECVKPSGLMEYVLSIVGKICTKDIV